MSAETVTPLLLAWIETQIAWDERWARLADRGEPWNATNPDAGVDPDGEPYLIYGDFGWVVRGAGVETEDSAQGKAEALHIATWDPARALAECAAKRRILARHTLDRRLLTVDSPDSLGGGTVTRNWDVCVRCTPNTHITHGQDIVEWPCPDVLDVAVAYRDRDGWVDGWAPT